jgi:Uncharacterized protein involved in tolerance to divalent cations
MAENFLSQSVGGDPEEVLVVVSNAPDMLLAKRIAHHLIEEHLAACVNVGASGVSMYMWEGNLEGGEEVALTMKTTRRRLSRLIARLHELHPYEVPEVLVLPVLGGSPAYMEWVRAQMREQQ